FAARRAQYSGRGHHDCRRLTSGELPAGTPRQQGRSHDGVAVRVNLMRQRRSYATSLPRGKNANGQFRDGAALQACGSTSTKPPLASEVHEARLKGHSGATLDTMCALFGGTIATCMMN